MVISSSVALALTEIAREHRLGDLESNFNSIISREANLGGREAWFVDFAEFKESNKKVKEIAEKNGYKVVDGTINGEPCIVVSW